MRKNERERERKGERAGGGQRCGPARCKDGIQETCLRKSPWIRPSSPRPPSEITALRTVTGQGPARLLPPHQLTHPLPFQLLQLIAKSQLTSLSGVAQKNYFNILDKIVQKGELLTDVFDNLDKETGTGFLFITRQCGREPHCPMAR